MNENNLEIDFKYILSTLKNKWYIIFICCITLSIGSYIVSSLFVTPIYIGEVTLFISNESKEMTNVDEGKQLLVDFKEIINTKLVTKTVKDNLGLNIDYAQFQKNIEVVNKGDSRLFKITYKSNYPNLSADIANQLAQIVVELSNKFVGAKNVKIIDKADIPQNPIGLKSEYYIVIAALTGILLSSIIILVFDYLRNTFKKFGDIESKLGLNVLGVIPKLRRVKRADKYIKDNMITITKPNDFISEKYRKLRTSIFQKDSTKKIQTILITSSSHHEGKSVTCANLAVVIAQSGKKVLLIDANFRDPSLHKYFDLKNENGFIEALTNEESLNIQKVNEIDGLNLLSSGKSIKNQTDILDSNSMATVLNSLKEKFDVLIIDSASISWAADASIISKIVDINLMLISCYETNVDKAKAAVKEFESINEKFHGVVFVKDIN